jgi:hypothetical protein
LSGVGISERTQQYRIHNAENGCVRSETQGEREHGYGGEAGILQQLAESEFEVVHKPVGEI